MTVGYLVLHKVMPEENQARYYSLTWQPALTGGWVIERSWGRLSSRQRQYKTEPAADLNGALAIVRSHVRRRLRHLYRVIERNGLDESVDCLGPSVMPRDTTEVKSTFTYDE